MSEQKVPTLPTPTTFKVKSTGRQGEVHRPKAVEQHPAELAARRGLGYPPFSRLILLRFEGPEAGTVETLAADAARTLRHRHHILVRGAQGALLRQVVGDTLPELRAAARPSDTRVIVDVDPQHML